MRISWGCFAAAALLLCLKYRCLIVHRGVAHWIYARYTTGCRKSFIRPPAYYDPRLLRSSLYQQIEYSRGGKIDHVPPLGK